MSSLVSKHNNCCPLCGNYLQVRHAVGGKVPNSNSIRCDNPHSTGRPYMYRFPPSATPAPSLPSNNVSSTSSASTRLPAVPAPAVPQSEELETVRCAHTNCISKRVDSGCSRRMCRKHCIKRGPKCTLWAHEKHRLELEKKKGLQSISSTAPSVAVSAAQSTAAVSTIPPIALSVGNDDIWDAFNAFTDSVGQAAQAPLRAIEEYRAGEDRRIAHEKQSLDAAVRWSAIERMDQEEADMELSIQQARAEAASPPLLLPPSSSSLQGTSSAPSPSLRMLSLSPSFPTTLLLPAPALGQAFAPNAPGATSLRPRKRVPAASIPKPSNAPPPLKITTQMNADWMASNGGPPIQGRSTGSNVPGPSTFHVKRTVSRRPYADLRQIQRFTLVYFDSDAIPPTIIVVDDCPRWPTYVLTTEMLKGLGRDIYDLDRFSPDHGVWIGINANYVHEVSTDCVVILRRRGIRGLREDETIQTFFPSKGNPAHLRYNLTGERSALRAQYKQKGKQAGKEGTDRYFVVSDSDSNTDVEVVADLREVSTSRKRQLNQDPGSSPARRRPRLFINTSPLIISDSPPSSSAPSSSALYPASRSVASTPATTPPPSAHVWPYGMHTVDMAAGFLRMDEDELAGIPMPMRFKLVFDATFHSSTYSDNRRLWLKASKVSPSLRQRFVDAGRTPRGLWSAFRAQLREELEVAEEKTRKA
ncbi:hypothetical protein B0H11DRAFT_2189956 [Mycena galericulata]|nr:hypothetical protein B0H11DRAFT_2189956 [Mycena galericulata]